MSPSQHAKKQKELARKNVLILFLEVNLLKRFLCEDLLLEVFLPSHLK